MGSKYPRVNWFNFDKNFTDERVSDRWHLKNVWFGVGSEIAGVQMPLKYKQVRATYYSAVRKALLEAAEVLPYHNVITFATVMHHVTRILDVDEVLALQPVDQR